MYILFIQSVYAGKNVFEKKAKKNYVFNRTNFDRKSHDEHKVVPVFPIMEFKNHLILIF